MAVVVVKALTLKKTAAQASTYIDCVKQIFSDWDDLILFKCPLVQFSTIMHIICHIFHLIEMTIAHTHGRRSQYISLEFLSL